VDCDDARRSGRKRADTASRDVAAGPALAFCTGAVERAPFGDGSFDLAWCAHSLYTLPDPVAALVELRRVVRRGGAVAVLEQDTLHRVILPWPVELELAIQQAQLNELRRRPNGPQKYFSGRCLSRLLEDAGLKTQSVRPFCCVRRAPLDEDERCFLAGYLGVLGERAGPHLRAADRRRFAALTDPDSSDYLLNRPDLYVTYLDILAIGQRV
jgi:SAM-dependent methyltransferase